MTTRMSLLKPAFWLLALAISKCAGAEPAAIVEIPDCTFTSIPSLGYIAQTWQALSPQIPERLPLTILSRSMGLRISIPARYVLTQAVGGHWGKVAGAANIESVEIRLYQHGSYLRWEYSIVVTLDCRLGAFPDRVVRYESVDGFGGPGLAWTSRSDAAYFKSPEGQRRIAKCIEVCLSNLKPRSDPNKTRGERRGDDPTGSD